MNRQNRDWLDKATQKKRLTVAQYRRLKELVAGSQPTNWGDFALLERHKLKQARRQERIKNSEWLKQVTSSRT